MPHVTDIPDLRVVPLDRIRPHEEVDPLRVAPLAARIASEGTQLNPVVCFESDGDDLVLLDGATRTAALRSLDLGFAVVQVVSTNSIELGTWHHVLRGVAVDEVMGSVRSSPVLASSDDAIPPRVWAPGVSPIAVIAVDVTPNRALTALVATYMGKWKSNRVTTADVATVSTRFPDWGALIEFPELTIPDVTSAALSADLLPAGITRFVVPDRALRLNYDLDELRAGGSALEKQERLNRILEERAREGKIRRYAEPVVILDD